MQPESSSSIVAELDAIILRSREAFKSRDATLSMEVFSPELQYRQADGKVIDFAQLRRDVVRQITTMHSGDTTFIRESLECVGDQATELYRQDVWYEVKAFLIIRRRWKVARRVRRIWRKTSQQWRVTEVDVLDEQITSRWGLF